MAGCCFSGPAVSSRSLPWSPDAVRCQNDGVRSRCGLSLERPCEQLAGRSTLQWVAAGEFLDSVWPLVCMERGSDDAHSRVWSVFEVTLIPRQKASDYPGPTRTLEAQYSSQEAAAEHAVRQNLASLLDQEVLEGDDWSAVCMKLKAASESGSWSALQNAANWADIWERKRQRGEWDEMAGPYWEVDESEIITTQSSRVTTSVLSELLRPW